MTGVEGAVAPTEPAPSRLPGRGSLLALAGDAAAVLPLVVLFLVLPGRDGGSDLRLFWPLVLAAVPALAIVPGQLRDAGRVLSILLAAWVVGLVLAVAVGVYRSDFVDPLLGYLVAPVLVLASRRLARHRLGLGILLLLVIASFGRYQYSSWLSWWGWTLLDSPPRWSPLSWWNPSAALMGMFAAWLLGVALAARRAVRWGLLLLAASGLTGAWLTGSRAGLAAAVGGVGVAAVIGVRAARARGDGWASTIAAPAGIVLAAAMIVIILSSMTTAGLAGSQPLLTRDQAVSTNASFRLDTWIATTKMWAARPLTGQGVGSFGALSHLWANNEQVLANGAHNEYLEVFAEGGILPGLALLAAAIGGGLLILRLMRRPVAAPDDPGDIRAGMLAGAAGALAVFLVHSGVDFDWEYPVLSGMAAVAAGVLLAQAPPRTEPRRSRWLSMTAGITLVSALVAGVWAGRLEMRPIAAGDAETALASQAPWATRAIRRIATPLIDLGEGEVALPALERLQDWSPADAMTDLLISDIHLRSGAISAEEFAALADRWSAWLSIRGRVAVELALTGHAATAQEVAQDLWRDVAAYDATRSSPARAELVSMEMVLAHQDGGCDAAFETGLARAREEQLPDVVVPQLNYTLERLGCGSGGGGAP